MTITFRNVYSSFVFGLKTSYKQNKVANLEIYFVFNLKASYERNKFTNT